MATVVGGRMPACGGAASGGRLAGKSVHQRQFTGHGIPARPRRPADRHRWRVGRARSALLRLRLVAPAPHPVRPLLAKRKIFHMTRAKDAAPAGDAPAFIPW